VAVGCGRDRELAKVEIKQEDVDVIMTQFEVCTAVLTVRIVLGERGGVGDGRESTA
jgi:hypothetical protein